MPLLLILILIPILLLLLLQSNCANAAAANPQSDKAKPRNQYYFQQIKYLK